MDMRSTTQLYTTARPEALLRSLVDWLRSRWPSLCFKIDTMTESGGVFNREEIEESWGTLSQPNTTEVYTEVYCFRGTSERSYFDEAGPIDLEMQSGFLMV